MRPAALRLGSNRSCPRLDGIPRFAETTRFNNCKLAGSWQTGDSIMFGIGGGGMGGGFFGMYAIFFIINLILKLFNPTTPTTTP